MMFYLFVFSSKRRELFAEFEDFTDIEHLGILKHCPTRWLSKYESDAAILALYPPSVDGLQQAVSSKCNYKWCSINAASKS